MIRRATIDYQSHRPQQQKNFDTIRDAPLNLEDDHISHIQLLFAGPHFRHILLMALTIKSPSSLCPAPFLLPRAATVLTFCFYSPPSTAAHAAISSACSSTTDRHGSLKSHCLHLSFLHHKQPHSTATHASSSTLLPSI